MGSYGQSRRQFLARTGGLLAVSGVSKVRGAEPDTRTSPDETYLVKGLSALANPKLRRNRDAHFGAAACAGFFLMDEQALDESTRQAITNQLDLMITAKSSLFRALPTGKPDPSRISEVAAAMEPDISRLKSLGHNVIFGALAVKALKRVPAMTTPAVIDGLKNMLARFESASPWTFLGWTPKQRREARVTPEDGFPDYHSEQILVRTALNAFLKIPVVYRPLHEGEVGHLLTLTDAVITMGRLGYPEIAQAAHVPHKLYVKLVGKGFDPGDYPHLKPRELFDSNPLEGAYWERQQEREWLGGHCFKYTDALFRLLPLVNEDTRRQCLKKMRWVW